MTRDTRKKTMSNKDGKLVPLELVELAWHIIQRFCKKYGVEDRNMKECEVSIIIALREQDRFEWTPMGKEFRRIVFINPKIDSDGKWKVLSVIGYDFFNQTLTDELNASIREACHDKWEQIIFY